MFKFKLVCGRCVKGTKDADGIKKSAKEEEVVYLREDVEENGMNGAVGIGEKDHKPSKDVEEETWTHEKIKAITDEMVYVAKDTTVANAIVAKAGGGGKTSSSPSSIPFPPTTFT